jgi:hypothetical protein
MTALAFDFIWLLQGHRAAAMGQRGCNFRAEAKALKLCKQLPKYG